MDKQRMIKIGHMTTDGDLVPPSGDPCPRCGGRYTERIDIITDDPIVWHCECPRCEKAFFVDEDGIEVRRESEAGS